MIITKGLVFVHIHKTGGQSIVYDYCIKHELQPSKHIIIGYENTEAHVKASEVRKVMGSDYGDVFKFTIVRNPFDRLVSFYHYGIERISPLFSSFDEFIFYVCGNHHLEESGSWEFARNSQTYYIDDDIDIIYHFEEFDFIREDLNKRIGVDITTHTNGSKHLHWSCYYNDKMKNAVIDKFKEDFINYYPELI